MKPSSFLGRHRVGFLWAALCIVLAWPMSPAQGANARSRCAHTLRQLAEAVHNFGTNNGGRFPKDICDKQGRPLLSWRVHLLPYIDQDSLYLQLHLDEPWDSAHNGQFLHRMPKDYGCSSQKREDWGWKTPYLAIRSANIGGVRDLDPTSRFTIMLVEVDDEWSVPWTKPGDLDADAATVLAALGRRHRLWEGIPQERGGFIVLANAAVRFIPESVDEALLQDLLTDGPGKSVSFPSLPWYAALSKKPLDRIIGVWLILTMCMGAGVFSVGSRLRRGKPISPGEMLWFSAGVAFLAHLVLVLTLYRYEPVPSSRGDQIIFWLFPTVLMTITSFCLPALGGFERFLVWRAAFLMISFAWLVIGMDALLPHQHRAVEESFVTVLAPRTLGAIALVMAFLTLTTWQAAAWRERWPLHWLGLFVCCLPFAWFTVCWWDGLVEPRELFQRILD